MSFCWGTLSSWGFRPMTCHLHCYCLKNLPSYRYFDCSYRFAAHLSHPQALYSAFSTIPSYSPAISPIFVSFLHTIATVDLSYWLTPDGDSNFLRDYSQSQCCYYLFYYLCSCLVNLYCSVASLGSRYHPLLRSNSCVIHWCLLCFRW